MANHNVRPKVFSSGQKDYRHSFFYRFFTSQRFLALVGLFLILLVAFPLAKSYSQKKVVEKEIDGLKQEIGQYEKQNQELKDMLGYLQSDQSLEEQARVNLNMKKPGETVVVIETAEDKTKKGGQSSEAKAEISNWQKWRNYFFGH